MSTYEKVVVIDGKGHLLGRLATTISKQILNGQRVVVVRCEEINVSGSHFRNKIKYSHYLNKRCLVNPKRGPFHFRAPSRMLYRVIRGMVPHKLARGAAALDRLKLFEGIPAPYNAMKRMVVPQALRALRLKPGRKFTSLKRMASEVGWKYEDVIAKLEAKRKVKSEAHYLKVKAAADIKAKAKTTENEKLTKLNTELLALGH